MNRYQWGCGSLPAIRTALAFAIFAVTTACVTQPPAGEVMKQMELAERAYEQHDWPEAEKHYRELSLRVPQDAYAFFRLGNVYAKQRRFDDAAAAYREALIRDSSFSKAYNNLGMIRLLQAEAALSDSVAKAPHADTASGNAARMLKEVRRITQIPVEDVKAPVGRKSGAKARDASVRNAKVP